MVVDNLVTLQWFWMSNRSNRMVLNKRKSWSRIIKMCCNTKPSWLDTSSKQQLMWDVVWSILQFLQQVFISPASSMQVPTEAHLLAFLPPPSACLLPPGSHHSWWSSQSNVHTEPQSGDSPSPGGEALSPVEHRHKCMVILNWRQTS